MRRHPHALWLLVLVLLVVGCSGALNDAIIGVNVASATTREVNKSLADMHNDARDAAIEASATPAAAKLAVEQVHRRFRPAWKAYTALRASVLAARVVVQTAQVAQAVGDTPSPVDILAALAKITAATRAFAEAMRDVSKPGEPATFPVPEPPASLTPPSVPAAAQPVPGGPSS